MYCVGGNRIWIEMGEKQAGGDGVSAGGWAVMCGDRSGAAELLVRDTSLVVVRMLLRVSNAMFAVFVH